MYNVINLVNSKYMNDLNKKILILDCQTTGMHPKNGFIFQLGWCTYDSESLCPPLIHKRFLQFQYEVISHIDTTINIWLKLKNLIHPIICF